MPALLDVETIGFLFLSPLAEAETFVGFSFFGFGAMVAGLEAALGGMIKNYLYILNLNFAH